MPRLLANHLRCGYVVGAGIAPIFALLLLLLDCIGVLRLNLNPWIAFSIQPTIDVVARSVTVTIALIFIPPLLIAPWVVRSRGSSKITRFLRARSPLWTYSYILLCALSGYGVIFANGLQILSGEALIGGARQPAHQSYYLLIQGALPTALLGVAAALVSLLGASNRFLGIPGTVSLEEYRSRLELVALPSDYAPIHGREKLNFNSGGLAPLLIGVSENWLSQIEKYQKLVPGSSLARSYLEERWEECKVLIQRFGITESAGHQLRLTVGTGRALEIALRELSQDPFVLLSPYEHPTEVTVARESFTSQQLKEDHSFFEKPWSEQAEWLALAVTDAVEQIKDKPVIFVVSEVAWSTGLVIPVHDLKSKIERELREVKIPINRWPLFIVDGAHAVGNLEGTRPVSDFDGYIFSAHKWLLSPEPAGFVVTAHARDLHDTWVVGVPASSVGASTVCGLSASLSLLARTDELTRGRRSADLKRRFLSGVRPQLVPVGENTGLEATSLVSLKPGLEYHWKWRANDLERYLREKGVTAEVVQFDDKIYWLRVCLPFFLDWRVLASMVNILKSIVVNG